jgi:hypothetical protein
MRLADFPALTVNDILIGGGANPRIEQTMVKNPFGGNPKRAVRALTQGRIFPPAALPSADDEISADEWGFTVTLFTVNADGAITVTGSRYPGFSGEVLPNLLPWFRTVVGRRFSH